jgi:hypothetical protein
MEISEDLRGGTIHKKIKQKKRRDGDNEREWEVRELPLRSSEAQAAEMISKLVCGFSGNTSDEETSMWITSMKEQVQGRPWEEENGAFITNSVGSLVMRCQRSLKMVVGVDFMTIVNMVQLAVKTDRYVLPLGC